MEEVRAVEAEDLTALGGVEAEGMRCVEMEV